MKLRKKYIIVIVIALMLAILFIPVPVFEDLHYGQICSKCLRQTACRKKSFAGITYFKSCKIQQGKTYINLAKETPETLCVDPNTYQQIFETKCKHHFKKAGFGAYIKPLGLFFYGMNKDGSFNERPLCRDRLRAIALIYRLFEKTNDKEQAKISYELVDTMHPPKKINIANESRKLLQQYVQKLKQAASLEDWTKVNNEFNKKLQNQKQTE